MTSYLDIYALAAGGDKSAYAFLLGWKQYVHDIDDIIDAETKDWRAFVRTLASANVLYTSPFYRLHVARLQPVVRSITSDYADSLAMAHGDDWQSVWSDTLRFSGNAMVMEVANITGGYALMRRVSPLLRENSWHTHHAADGSPH